jgi:hypothetical protein
MRWLQRACGIVVVVAAAVMFGALFIPFATQGCIFCPIAAPGRTFTLPSFSLTQGLDGWVVLLIVVALILESSAMLMRSRYRLSAVASLVFAAAALGVCIFDGLDASGRVVGLDAVPPPLELGGTGVVPKGINPPASLDVGFYLFLTAAVVALIAATVIVVMSRRTGGRLFRPTGVPVPTP